MTDLEINKALALAIGWRPHQTVPDFYNQKLYIFFTDQTTMNEAKRFDYRDWNVIGPIAERYDAFPFATFDGLWRNGWCHADTPQKAIAMAVIEGAKK